MMAAPRTAAAGLDRNPSVNRPAAAGHSLPDAPDNVNPFAPTVDADGHTVYPEALLSALSKKYHGPVLGTAVIDSDYPAIDVLVEMVTPDASPLLDPLTMEFIQDCVEEMDKSCQNYLARGGPVGFGGSIESSFARLSGSDTASADAASISSGAHPRPGRTDVEGEAPPLPPPTTADVMTPSASPLPPLTSTESDSLVADSPNGRVRGRRSDSASFFSSRGSGSVSTHRTGAQKLANLLENGLLGSGTRGPKKKKDADRRLKRVLKEGGFIVFTDEYLQAHPMSAVSSITQEFQLVNPLPDQPPLDASLDESKQRVEAMKRLIAAAEEQYRPLFRRRPAALVYGESRYVSRKQISAEKSTDDDADVFIATSCGPEPSPAAGSPPSNTQKGPASPSVLRIEVPVNSEGQGRVRANTE